ncbi:hypothetical protein J5N97_007153 [Dioscorea zingiberensis]|uniref:DUF4408 domain-containing protein n=1 Tax=Dioscorea zingiberensis TaxID=325984 RepID=A0A9D5DE74_9LILI|nr:hypothetical protein J5N97_007153 [Dioscorea zingiberensis]
MLLFSIPKYLFIVCNIIIIVYLAGDSNKLSKASPATDIYEEYEKRNQREMTKVESHLVEEIDEDEEDEEDDQEDEGVDGEEMKKKFDDFIAKLVSGNSTLETNFACVPSGKDACDFDFEPDCMWKEGVIEENTGSWTNNMSKESRPSLAEEVVDEEDDINWEEGICQGPANVTDGLAEQRSHSGSNKEKS